LDFSKVLSYQNKFGQDSLTGFPEVFTVDILGQGKYTIPLEEFWVGPSEKNKHK